MPAACNAATLAAVLSKPSTSYMATARNGAAGTTDSTQFQLVCRAGCQQPVQATGAGGAGVAAAGAAPTVVAMTAADTSTVSRRRMRVRVMVTSAWARGCSALGAGRS